MNIGFSNRVDKSRVNGVSVDNGGVSVGNVGGGIGQSIPGVVVVEHVLRIVIFAIYVFWQNSLGTVLARIPFIGEAVNEGGWLLEDDDDADEVDDNDDVDDDDDNYNVVDDDDDVTQWHQELHRGGRRQGEQQQPRQLGGQGPRRRGRTEPKILVRSNCLHKEDNT